MVLLKAGKLQVIIKGLFYGLVEYWLLHQKTNEHFQKNASCNPCALLRLLPWFTLFWFLVKIGFIQIIYFSLLCSSVCCLTVLVSAWLKYSQAHLIENDYMYEHASPDRLCTLGGFKMTIAYSREFSIIEF